MQIGDIMSKLKIKQNSLEKARNKFEKQSRRNKQFQINFERRQNKKGKFVTKANIVRGTKENHYRRRGILHSAVYTAKYRVKGDVPSLTKKINSFEPRSRKGKAFKATAKTTNFIAKNVGKTVLDVGLAAETFGLTSIRLAGNAAVLKAKNMTFGKYGQYAFDDTNRAMLAGGKLIIGGTLGAKNHFKTKKRYKLERARFKLQKEELKEFKKSTFKPQFNANKAELKEAKEKLKVSKHSYKVSSKSNVRKALLDLKKTRFVQQKKELKLKNKQLKSQKKFMVKEKLNQWRLQDLSRPTPLVFKPISAGTKGLTASAYQKALYADERNDAMQAINKVGVMAKFAVRKTFGTKKSLQRHQKQNDKLQKQSGKKRTKLQTKSNRLKKKSSILNQSWKSNQKSRKQSAENAKRAGTVALKAIAIPAKFLATHLLLVLIFIIFVMLILTLFNGTIEAIFGNSGWVMGTYASQDYDLSEAEKYYTKLAYDMNEKILKVSSSDDWKDGLAEFGANKRNLKDKPDNWYWGSSSEYDWDPVYDFDVYKLWSFLCAYYYDFDSDSNGDIDYWEFDENTEDLLEEIFKDEYEFVYWYDNRSRWEELSTYNYWGGGNAESGTYYRAEQNAYIYDNQPYKYRFKPIAYTSELSQYFDSEGYVCINSDYRVLNPNDDYALTGFVIMDHRYFSGTSEPFYYIDNATGTFFFMHGGTRYDRSFWGWDGNDAWFLVSPTDTHIWNDSINDACMYGYYEKFRWKTECNLYYNVKQKKTFDKVIEDKLKNQSHSDERIEYYKLLSNQDTNQENESEPLYGNHQTLRNMLPGNTIRDYSIKQAFGYDMWEWNSANDGLYQGIKYYCDNSADLFAPFDCEIKNVDTNDKKITLRKDDVEYWYDGSGGTDRDTEVTITNAELLSSFSEGDKIKEGEKFAKTTYTNVNFHIEIDTDGYGWDYIDPRLVIE